MKRVFVHSAACLSTLCTGLTLPNAAGALAKGYATASTWLGQGMVGHRQRSDFGYSAHPLAREVAEQSGRTYYDKMPARSYFVYSGPTIAASLRPASPAKSDALAELLASARKELRYAKSPVVTKLDAGGGRRKASRRFESKPFSMRTRGIGGTILLRFAIFRLIRKESI